MPMLPRLTDPHGRNRLLTWMSRATWLILASTAGTAVGRVILVVAG